MSTSNRRQAFAQPQSNPSTKFIEWKSDKKSFEYYNKEKGEKIELKLPLKFLALDELSTVKGWNENLKGNIISNEVRYISKETMNVVTFHKDGNGKSIKTDMAKGLYSEIKEKIKAAGAHYVKSVYVMLEDGSLANLQLKTIGCQAWGDFTKNNRSRLSDEWVTVKTTLEGKKGVVKFNSPVFAFDKSLSEDEMNQADEAFGILEVYLKAYLVKAEPSVTDAPEESDPVDEDDLEF